MEWAEVHGNLYGTSLAEIERARADAAVRRRALRHRLPGRSADPRQGARRVGVFILPPSMPELLKRLRGRASDDEEVVQRRFQVAMREIEHYALFDYVVVNDELEQASETLCGDHPRRACQARPRRAHRRAPPPER